ncbi:hypothetical protein HYH03_011740 [Edaphochlamys debaryana]|uniref:Uncharacterized protein n=1 Tax=Edaphochlamys debaryana TaxID=47281 RepID=A0A836BUP3_9CHLO|nr:hypothetical protein HYH03_011740 [Edaphochlamys debaryana]|eukprot:KAG2489791.1 hypothetical protein HYH03_011740 [Edaphochlamys debaryana]
MALGIVLNWTVVVYGFWPHYSETKGKSGPKLIPFDLVFDRPSLQRYARFITVEEAAHLPFLASNSTEHVLRKAERIVVVSDHLGIDNTYGHARTAGVEVKGAKKKTQLPFRCDTSGLEWMTKSAVKRPAWVALYNYLGVERGMRKGFAPGNTSDPCLRAYHQVSTGLKKSQAIVDAAASFVAEVIAPVAAGQEPAPPAAIPAPSKALRPPPPSHSAAAAAATQPGLGAGPGTAGRVPPPSSNATDSQAKSTRVSPSRRRPPSPGAARSRPPPAVGLALLRSSSSGGPSPGPQPSSASPKPRPTPAQRKPPSPPASTRLGPAAGPQRRLASAPADAQPRPGAAGAAALASAALSSAALASAALASAALSSAALASAALASAALSSAALASAPVAELARSSPGGGASGPQAQSNPIRTEGSRSQSSSQAGGAGALSAAPGATQSNPAAGLTLGPRPTAARGSLVPAALARAAVNASGPGGSARRLLPPSGVAASRPRQRAPSIAAPFQRQQSTGTSAAPVPPGAVRPASGGKAGLPAPVSATTGGTAAGSHTQRRVFVPIGNPSAAGEGAEQLAADAGDAGGAHSGAREAAPTGAPVPAEGVPAAGVTGAAPALPSPFYVAIHVRPYPDKCMDYFAKMSKYSEKAAKKVCKNPRVMSDLVVRVRHIAVQRAAAAAPAGHAAAPLTVFVMSHPKIRNKIRSEVARIWSDLDAKESRRRARLLTAEPAASTPAAAPHGALGTRGGTGNATNTPAPKLPAPPSSSDSASTHLPVPTLLFLESDHLPPALSNHVASNTLLCAVEEEVAHLAPVFFGTEQSTISVIVAQERAAEAALPGGPPLHTELVD